VRMALGATRRDVVALVVTQAAWPVLFGIGIGVATSFPLSRVLSTQLFGVRPNDPITFAAVSCGLALVALLASLIPATRAASVDPTRALHGN
jgi:putative ABC transport system permease protein